MSTYISLLIGLYTLEKYCLFKAHVIQGVPKPNYEHILSWHLNNYMAQMDDDLFDPEKWINEPFFKKVAASDESEQATDENISVLQPRKHILFFEFVC